MIAIRRAKGMKAALALAAILTISVSTCSQLHAQSDAKEIPHSQQIPNSDPGAHAQSVPNWASTEGVYVQPIPNWRPAPPVQTDSSTLGNLTTSHIVEDLPLTGRTPIRTTQLDAQSGARQYPHAEKLPNPIEPSPKAAGVIQVDTLSIGEIISPATEDLPLRGRNPIRLPELYEQLDVIQGAHSEQIPNWNVAQSAGPEPIPGWREPPETSVNGKTIMKFAAIRACVIVKQDGKSYQYVEGILPGGAKPTKSFSDADIRKIVQAGATVKILGRGYGEAELEAERNACRVEKIISK
jgi:hypothetical protein